VNAGSNDVTFTQHGFIWDGQEPAIGFVPMRELNQHAIFLGVRIMLPECIAVSPGNSTTTLC